MLSPNAKEIVSAQDKAERGKRIEEELESSNSELLSLLTKVREKLKRRDEQLNEELRWRDTNQVVKEKKREESLEALLQHRDEE